MFDQIYFTISDKEKTWLRTLVRSGDFVVVLIEVVVLGTSIRYSSQQISPLPYPISIRTRSEYACKMTRTLPSRGLLSFPFLASRLWVFSFLFYTRCKCRSCIPCPIYYNTNHHILQTTIQATSLPFPLTSPDHHSSPWHPTPLSAPPPRSHLIPLHARSLPALSPFELAR